MSQKKVFLPVLLLSALCGAAARFYNLKSSVDEMGMTISGHATTKLLIGISAVLLLLLLVLSIFSQGRSGSIAVIRSGKKAAYFGMGAGAVILLSVLLSFLEARRTPTTISAPVLLVLGIAGSICLILIPKLRSGNDAWHPAYEILPLIFLIIRLVLNFKNWSTDPIIPDYCTLLFGLIFILLAVYNQAGFVFSAGRPRRTLFYSASGVYFSAMAAVDGFYTDSIGTALFYLGFLLWLVPAVPRLLVPNAAPEKKKEK